MNRETAPKPPETQKHSESGKDVGAEWALLHLEGEQNAAPFTFVALCARYLTSLPTGEFQLLFNCS